MVFQALCLASAVSFNPIAFRGEWWVVHSGPGHSMPKKELGLTQARLFRAPRRSRLMGIVEVEVVCRLLAFCLPLVKVEVAVEIVCNFSCCFVEDAVVMVGGDVNMARAL